MPYVQNPDPKNKKYEKIAPLVEWYIKEFVLPSIPTLTSLNQTPSETKAE
jgi:hypothetical protein